MYAPGRRRGGTLAHMTPPVAVRRPSAVILVALALLFALVVCQGTRADPLTDLIVPDSAPAADPAAPATIDAESSPAVDAEIARRLRGIYAELDALDGIVVSVASGIVTLDGEADSARAAERAVAIAAQVEGVVEVVDETRIDTNVARRLRTTLERMRTGAVTTLAALPVLLLALGIVALFWWLGRRLARRESLFAALAPNTFIAELLGGIARVAVVLVGLFLALSLLDATSIIGTVLGAAGIVGLAVGFAVRDTVENWIASVLLSLRTPFVARDYVRIGEHEGAVARLTSRATILISLDGNHIRIPNATVFKSVIVNFTRNPERRFDFGVGVDTGLDLNEARCIALEAVHEVPGVLDSPPASVVVETLGDSNVTLTVMAWIDQRENDVRKVKSEAIRFVKQAFDAAGIVMPEPIYRINVGTPGGSGAAVRALGAIADPDSPVDATISSGSGDSDDSGDSGDSGGASDASGAGESERADTTDGAGADEGSGSAAHGPGEAGVAGSAGRREPTSPPRRLRASDAADTSLDAGVEATLEREIDEGGSQNLLGDDVPRE